MKSSPFAIHLPLATVIPCCAEGCAATVEAPALPLTVGVDGTLRFDPQQIKWPTGWVFGVVGQPGVIRLPGDELLKERKAAVPMCFCPAHAPRRRA